MAAPGPGAPGVERAMLRLASKLTGRALPRVGTGPGRGVGSGPGARGPDGAPPRGVGGRPRLALRLTGGGTPPSRQVPEYLPFAQAKFRNSGTGGFPTHKRTAARSQR